MQPSTKAQIQIGETIAVIMIFIVLMIFALYWFSTASTASNEQQAQEFDRTELLQTAKMVMGLPELHCSVAGVRDTACIDLFRMQAVTQQIRESPEIEQRYRDLFIGAGRGSYEIEIHAVYPGTPQKYTVFDFTQNNPEASQQQVAIPVTLYNPITQYKQFSMMVLTQQVIS